jgi:hypothetical protein
MSVKVLSVRLILYSITLLPDELRVAGLTMSDSIRDSIVTPYITNLSGKDSNRCQMTRMFFRPDMFLGYVLSFLRHS